MSTFRFYDLCDADAEITDTCIEYSREAPSVRAVWGQGQYGFGEL
jgi:hypothetical protein